MRGFPVGGWALDPWSGPPERQGLREGWAPHQCIARLRYVDDLFLASRAWCSQCLIDFARATYSEKISPASAPAATCLTWFDLDISVQGHAFYPCAKKQEPYNHHGIWLWGARFSKTPINISTMARVPTVRVFKTSFCAHWKNDSMSGFGPGG